MVQAVDVTNFVTSSEASYQAFKTASLLKTLSVNALIMGEVGVGKKSLASFILPEASIIDASQFDEVLVAVESSSELIITNIDNSANIKRLTDAINEYNVRVIATSKQSFNNEFINNIFNVKFTIPPLKERIEDVEPLIKQFIKEASTIFRGDIQFNIENFQADLTKNSHSLRRQVMINYLLQDIKDQELMEIIEHYLYNKLGSNNDYRNFLYLYEVPLIKSGLGRFKSQLQLSDRLGLNRNTLRKKISDNKQYLAGDTNE